MNLKHIGHPTVVQLEKKKIDLISSETKFYTVAYYMFAFVFAWGFKLAYDKFHGSDELISAQNQIKDYYKQISANSLLNSPQTKCKS